MEHSRALALGMPWAAEHTDRWEVVRLKDIAEVVNGYPFDAKLFDATGIHPLVRIRDLNATEAETRYNGDWVPAAEIDTGDVLVGMDGDFNVAVWKGGKALLNQRMCCIRGATPLLSKFLSYVLPAPLKVINDLTYCTTVKHLSSKDVERITLFLPPPRDLSRVVSFLDEQTARIDALIAEKERLVATLDAATHELLHDAVTKGIRGASLSNSGRSWIGEIPSHWTAPYIRFVARLESGHTPSRQVPAYWENCTIPWFGLTDVWQIRDGKAEVVSETTERISELGLANSSARLLPAGTVMLSRTASVGFSAIMGVPMATTQDFVNWVCGPKVLPEYLLYVLRSMRSEFERLKFGSTHSTIYMPDVAKFAMPLPPLDEQKEIVEFARARKRRMEELREVASDAASRLREYRSSLISAAVTGQLDIDSYAPECT